MELSKEKSLLNKIFIGSGFLAMVFGEGKLEANQKGKFPLFIEGNWRRQEKCPTHKEAMRVADDLDKSRKEIHSLP